MIRSPQMSEENLMASASMEYSYRPEISPPMDFEHFLHIGTDNLDQLGPLSVSQQQTFEQVAERRRRLPQVPEKAKPSSSAIDDVGSSFQHSLLHENSSSSSTLKRDSSTTAAPFATQVAIQTSKTKREEKLKEARSCIMASSIEGLEEILASGISVNQPDDDGYTLLDVAVMHNEAKSIRLLLLYGGVERESYLDPEERLRHLEKLMSTRQGELTALGQLTKDTTSKVAIKEIEKKRKAFDRLEALNVTLKKCYSSAGTPGAPSMVTAHAFSATSVLIAISPPLTDHGGVVLRYKVEWSRFPNFDRAGFVVIPAVTQEYILRGLVSGIPWYIRVSACNIRGFGPCCASMPGSCTPTSWRDVARGPDRLALCERAFLDISAELKAEFGDLGSEGQEKEKTSRSSVVKLFGTSQLKVTKTAKRGLYIALAMADEFDPSRIVVHSSGSGVPLILVEEAPAGDIAADFAWLQKVCMDYSLVKLMGALADPEIPSLLLRYKLIQTLMFLQDLLEITDVGKVHHEIIREKNGSAMIVLTRVLDARLLRSVGGSLLATKPFSWGKLESLTSKGGDAPEMLNAKLGDILKVVRSSNMGVEPGLYLGMVDPLSTISSLQIKLLKSATNMLPIQRVRALGHISKPEWEGILKMADDSTAPQSELRSALAGALVPLGRQVHVSSIGEFRLYGNELIELDRETAMMLLLPPHGEFLQGTSGSAVVEHPDMLAIPIATFEMLLWSSFQPALVKTYCRLHTVVSCLVLRYQHALKVAFTNEETATAKNLLAKAMGLDERTAEAWSFVSWFKDVIRWGRENQPCPITAEKIRKGAHARIEPPVKKHQAGETPKDARKLNLEASARRLSSDASTTGDMMVHAEINGQKVLRKVMVTQLTTTSEIVDKLVAEAMPDEDPNEYALFLYEPGRNPRRLANDSRPLLMQSRWEEKGAKIVLLRDVFRV